MLASKSAQVIAFCFLGMSFLAAADPCTQGTAGLPSVQISVTPEARKILKSSRLTDVSLKHAVSAALTNGHVGCIPDNAITYPVKAEDWVSVSISAQSKIPDKPLAIDASVRNGAAVTNQIIRWRERRAVGAGQQQILDGIASVLKDLAATYGSDEYRKGRREE